MKDFRFIMRDVIDLKTSPPLIWHEIKTVSNLTAINHSIVRSYKGGGSKI